MKSQFNFSNLLRTKFKLKILLLLLVEGVSAQIAKERLDSIVEYEGNSIDGWIKTHRYLYRYDTEGRVLQFDYNFFFKDDSVWRTTDQKLYTWDNAGRVKEIKMTRLVGIGPFEMINFKRFTYEYNESNKLAKEIMYDWNKALSVWEKRSIQNYLYENDQLITKTTEFFDTSKNPKDPDEKVEYTYNNNLLVSEIESHFNVNYNAWVYSSKVEYEYDNNQRKIKEIIWRNDFTVYTSPNEMDEYVYDNNGVLLETKETYNLHSEVYVWSKTTKNDYNLLVEKDKLLLPFTNLKNPSEFGYDFQITSSTDYISRLDSLGKEENKYDHYYSTQIVNSTHQAEVNKANVYPNPCINNVVVSVEENSNYAFSLFDVQGKEVFNSNLIGTSSIDLSFLPQGIYFYSISNSQGKQSGKLVKE